MQLAQELLTNIQCSGVSRSFAKETRVLKMRSRVASHQKLITIIESHYWSWSSYNLTREVAKELCQPFYGHSAFETNWKSEKADQKFLKIIILKCPLLLFYATIMNHFSIRLGQAMKSGFYKVTSDDQLSDWMEKKLKALPKANLHQKKVRVTLWQSAACLIHYSFLNPSKIITSEKYAQQIDDMYENLLTTTASIGQQKGPNSSPWQDPMHITQPVLQKLNELNYKVLPHLPYLPDLSPTDYHVFRHLNNFLWGKCFHNQQDVANAF